MQRAARSALPAAGGLAVATISVGLQAWRRFGLPLDTMDESILLEYPRLVGEGRVPNVDFYTVYGRLGFEFLDAWYDVVGYTVLAERCAGLLYHLAIVVALWFLTSRYGALPATAAALLAVVFLPPDLVAYAWLGGLSLCLWSLVLVRAETSRFAWVSGGLLGGLAAGFRYELLLLALLIAVVFGWRHRRARYAGLGLAVGLVPTALHLVVAAPEVFDNIVVGRMGTNFQVDQRLVSPLVYVGLGLCAAAIGLLLRQAVVTRDRELTAWALVSVATVPQALQRVDTYHLGFAAIVILPLALATCLGTLASRRPTPRSPAGLTMVALGAAVAVSVGTTLVSAAREMPATAELAVDGHEVALAPDHASSLAATVADLEELVPPGARLFAGTTDMGRTAYHPFPLYFLLADRYEFTAYYQELAAGVAERDGSGLADDIRAADALVLYDFPPRFLDLLFPHAPRGFTGNNEAVQESFTRVRTHGQFALYLRQG